MAADFLKKDYLFLAVGVVGGACSDVEQKLVQVTKFSKRDQLLDLLKITGNHPTHRPDVLFPLGVFVGVVWREAPPLTSRS